MMVNMMQIRYKFKIKNIYSKWENNDSKNYLIKISFCFLYHFSSKLENNNSKNDAITIKFIFLIINWFSSKWDNSYSINDAIETIVLLHIYIFKINFIVPLKKGATENTKIQYQACYKPYHLILEHDFSNIYYW